MNKMVKPGEQWGAAPCGSITPVPHSLSQPVVSNSEAKISTWLNKSMVLINLPEAPLRSSRPSVQRSSVVPTGFGGHRGKGKAWHSVTAGIWSPAELLQPIMENFLIVCLTVQQFGRQPAVRNMLFAQGVRVCHVTDSAVQSEGKTCSHRKWYRFILNNPWP